MNLVEIIVGKSWQEDVRFIDSLRGRRPSESTLRLSDIRDIIDIVVDGTNLTAAIPEEAIFDLVADVLAALVSLIEATSKKVIVEFQHEPWEFVIVADDASLRLSLYSIDRRRKVVAHDLAVEARAFVDALCHAAEQMLTDLFRVSEDFSTNRQIRQISQSLSRLKRARHLRLKPFKEASTRTNEDAHIVSTSAAGGLTLGYEIDRSDAALSHYRGAHTFDLHALLFNGVVKAELGSQDLILAQGYPFLAISSLLDRTRQLFNQIESHANAPFCLDEKLPHLGFEVHGEGSRWRLRAFDLEHEAWREWTAPPDECLDALVSLGEYLVRDLRSINPHLEVNQRFLDMEIEVEKLRYWYVDLCGNNLYHDRPEDYLRHLGHLQPETISKPVEPDFPWPLTRVHTLFPKRKFSIRSRRIDFSSLRLTAHGLILPTQDSIRCLDPVTGASRWVQPYREPLAFNDAVRYAGSWMVLSPGDQTLRMLDLETGATRATVETPTLWRDLTGAAHFAREDLLVVASSKGEIIAFEPSTGRLRWRYSASPGRSHSVVFDGPLICVQSSEGVLAALNPQSGAALWKVRIGGTPEQPLRLHQGRLYSIAHDPLQQGSTLHSIYPFTGRSVWQIRLPGFLCGPISFVDHWMVAPVERRGQIVLIGIDLEAVDPRPNWQIPLSSAGVDRPTAVLPLLLENVWHGLVRTDRAELTCFRVGDGAVRWRVIPTEETLLLYGNLPLFTVRDALVNVSRSVDLRHLHSGRLLHSFDAIEAPEFGFLAAPFCLLLGERAPQVDEIDQLTAFSVDHFLAVVES